MRGRVGLLAVAVVLVSVLVGGCSAPAARPTAPGGSSTPAGDTAGEALVQQKCDSCHNLDRVDDAVKTEQEWALTIERMVGLGLVVTDAEKKQIVEYLAERDAAR